MKDKLGMRLQVIRLTASVSTCVYTIQNTFELNMNKEKTNDQQFLNFP